TTFLGGSSNPQFTAISRPSVVDSYLSSRGGNMPMFSTRPAKPWHQQAHQ
ncbi:hypothetical protein BASA60_003588, partial [Batrachochytrium salamandrivorans]